MKVSVLSDGSDDIRINIDFLVQPMYDIGYAKLFGTQKQQNWSDDYREIREVNNI